MYTKVIMSLFLFCHIIADFYLQDNKMVNGKKENSKILFLHVLYFFLCSLLLMIFFVSWLLLKIIFILTILHLIIDKGKIELEKSNQEKNMEFIYIIIDQIIHFFAIIMLYPLIKNIELNETIKNHIILPLVKMYPILDKISINIWAYLILLLAFYLFNINGGTILTKKVIEAFKKEPNHVDNETKRWKGNYPIINFEIAVALENEISKQETNKDSKVGAGEIIGNIERILIFTFLIFNKYSVIAFVLTAKSIARFKELEKQNFSDIYLIGTLTSYSIAIITGILLNLIAVYFLGINFGKNF